MLNKEMTHPIDAHLIGFCPVPPEEEDREYISRIWSVYLVDTNTQTYCCDTNPSYYMHHLYDSIEPSPKGELLDEKAREKLMDRYELHFDEEYSGYMDRHRIDELIKRARQMKDENVVYHHIGKTNVPYEEESYDQQMERLAEFYRGNRVL
jgi:hypothetical protein